jgi:uncharacterized protein (DUF58 family)
MKIHKEFEWMKKFLDGPEWFYVPALERTSRPYRSPTVALSAWLLGWAFRTLTVPGRIIIPSAFMILMYSSISLDSPVRGLAITLFIIFLVDFITGWLFRPKFKICRKLPERVRAGACVKVSYEITNLRRISAWDIRLDPFALKPGLKWAEHAATGVVPAGQCIAADAVIDARRRGKYTIFSPIADSAFPLGIFKWNCRNKNDTASLIVYPSYQVLNDFRLPVGMKYQREGVSRVSKVGESMDFFGCREFREGDDPRHIYWPGSARSAGNLIVKEFQEEYLTRIALIVDTYVPKVKSFRVIKKRDVLSAELEAAISLTAALTDFLTKGEYVVDVFAAGTQVYHFQAGRHLACLEAILDVLACLEPNNEHPISRLSPDVLEEVSGIGSAVIMLLGWDRERETLVRKLRESGVALRIIVIGNGIHSGEPPPDATFISTADISEGRVKHL